MRDKRRLLLEAGAPESDFMEECRELRCCVYAADATTWSCLSCEALPYPLNSFLFF